MYTQPSKYHAHSAFFGMLLASLFFIFLIPATQAGEKMRWSTSLPQALERARVEKKMVMAYFTGSDWCGFCQLLENEVFATPEFKRWANENVVPLYLDFPQTAKLPPAQEQHNTAIRDKMGVSALPRIIFFDAQGQALSSMGYTPGGAKHWLEMAKMLLPRKTELELSLAAAQKQAATQQRPLLILVRIGEAAAAKQKVAALLTDPMIQRNSGDNLLVYQLNLAAAGAEELALWRELAARHQLGAEFPAALLLDGQGAELLKASGTTFHPDELSRKIAHALPKPAYNGEWLTDLPKAMRLARALNRPLLLNFTGSDWCGYCQRLDAEVFSTPTFQNYANSNLILVTLDFPRGKQLPDRERLQNKFVQETFGVDGFPYELILDHNGNPLGALGYTGDTPENFVAQLKEALAPKGRTGSN